MKQAAPVAEPAPRRLPYVSKTIEAKPVSQPKKLSTPEVSTPELIPTPPAPVDTKTVPTVGMRSNSMGKTGHEADYSWITGELQKAEGIWVLRYASSNGKDNFGGYVMLFSEVDMRNFKEGDLVSVRGNIINASARGQQAAHYRASTVDLIER